MHQGFVIDERDGRRVAVAGTLVIGRVPECGLMIEDSAASRRHVEIVQRNGGFHWKDLGSTNGTYLNGNRMLAGELKDGDVLTIGETSLRLAVEEVKTPPPASASPSQAEATSPFHGTLFNLEGQPARSDTNKTALLLETVYSVMNAIATEYDPNVLIERILTTTLGAIDAQRGAIVLDTDPETPGDDLVQLMERGVLRTVPRSELRHSSTVQKRVLEKGESLLFQDSDADSELNAAESIVALKLRSIICVPLRAKAGIIGLLYIDSNRPDKAYTQDDLLLATAVGNSAGLALENAQMHQAILEKQRIEHEIATAWSIQEGFLVRQWPEHKRYEVFGDTRPAKTVGGDFYDYLEPFPGCVGVLIGDVSGKGVPASLTMAQLLAEFRVHARVLKSPAAVLGRLNVSMAERTRYGMFCTVCYLLIDLDSGRLTVANAGHHAGLQLGAGVQTLPGPSGPPLGIIPTAAWKDETLFLTPGDTVLLYTDGIIEARPGRSAQRTSHIDVEAEEYGEARIGALAGRCSGHSAAALVQALYEDVRDYCAPGSPHDDCTSIAVRYLGPGE